MFSRPHLLLIVIACLLLSWWLAHPPGTTLPGHPQGTTATCPLPPPVTLGADPHQSDVPADLHLPARGNARFTPLAGFSVDARVLGREDYHFGHEAAFSPTDLALGWGRMADPAVLARLDIRQSGRWYFFRWHGNAPPIPLEDIVRSSANMHIVPANAQVAAALEAIRPGQHVRIDGWLIRIDDGNWHWISSLRRDDSGNGACELVYACAIRAR